MRSLLALLALALLLFATPSGAIEAEPAGPEGGRIFALAIDPADPRIVYVGTEGGIYKGADYGETWAYESRGLGAPVAVRALAVHPQDSEVLWAGTDRGLYKTADAGESWAPVETAPTGSPVSALVLDPADPSVLYAGLRSDPEQQESSLFKSSDGGETWVPLFIVPVHGIQPGISVLTVSGRTVFAASGSYLYRSLDAGGTWRRLLGVRGDIHTIAVRRRIVWVGTSDGAFRSLDGGATWQESERGMIHPGVQALAFDPADPRVLYASSSSQGIFKSTDRGNHWSPARQGIGRREALILVVDPSDPSRLYAGTSLHGVFRSENRGATWQASNHGLRAARVDRVSMRPRGGLYASIQGRLLESTDGGRTWRAPTQPIYRLPEATGELERSLDGGRTWEEILNYAELLAIDPADPWHLFAVEATGELGGIRVRRSTNGGTTWVSSHLGCSSLYDLVAAPGGREVYIGGSAQCALGSLGGGLSRSLDGGVTWEEDVLIDPSLQVIFQTAAGVVVDPRDPARVFVNYGGYDPVAQAGVWEPYRSLDRGTTWTRIDAPSLDLLFPPGSPDTVLAWHEGLWKSTDGGVTWTLFDPLEGWTIHNFAADSNSPGVVYAATPGGLFRIAVE